MNHEKPASERNGAWPIIGWVVAAAASVCLRALINSSWKAAKGEDPPKDPSDRKVSWGQALAWGAALGAAAGMARVVGRRTVSHLASDS